MGNGCDGRENGETWSNGGAADRLLMDAYREIEVEFGASFEKIKESKRRLVKDWHPDRFESSQDKLKAEKRMASINLAYERLKRYWAGRASMTEKIGRASEPRRPRSGKIVSSVSNIENTGWELPADYAYLGALARRKVQFLKVWAFAFAVIVLSTFVMEAEHLRERGPGGLGRLERIGEQTESALG